MSAIVYTFKLINGLKYSNAKLNMTYVIFMMKQQSTPK